MLTATRKESPKTTQGRDCIPLPDLDGTVVRADSVTMKGTRSKYAQIANESIISTLIA